MSNDNMRVGFVGAGKVGCSLGKILSKNNVHLVGYYSRGKSSASDAAAFTGSAALDSLQHVVASCDAIFLTVPDAAINEVYRQLCEFDISGKDILHCSGSLSAAEAFPEVKLRGANAYSIHPLFPVSSKTECYEELSRAFFSIEGDGPHLDWWKSTFEGFGAHVQLISGQNKKKYHAACAISSNLVCALVQESLELLGQCGFDENGALKALAPLMSANIEHVISEGPTMALTGPVERNDVQTVSAHLECLESDPVASAMYRGASKKLVQMARNRHPNVDYQKMESILNADS